jgi:hypothetical protein
MNISLSNQQMSEAEIRAGLAPLLKKLVGEVAARLA